MNAILAPRNQRLRTPLGFVLVALLVYLIDGAIVHSPAFAASPDLITAAVSIDLTLVVTFAYWALVIKPGHAALRTAVPVFILSVGAAALTLPAGHRDVLHDIRYLGIPFELATLALVIAAVRRSQRLLAEAGVVVDVPERIRASLTGAGLPARVADVVTMEFSVLFYALASWRRKPFSPHGSRAFSYHQRNSFAAILYTLFLASAVEAVAMDFLMRAFAPRLAVGLLVVSVFGALWVLGFARSVQLRPIWVTTDTLHVRNGLQWTVEIPRADIERVEFGRVKPPAKGTPGYLRATLGQPNVLIDLRSPVNAVGAYGRSRAVTRIALVIDDLAGFQRAVS
jgi:hypothetical protein